MGSKKEEIIKILEGKADELKNAIPSLVEAGFYVTSFANKVYSYIKKR